MVSHIKSVPEYAYDALVEEIRAFQNQLSAEMEIGIIAADADLALRIETLRLSGQIVVMTGVDGEGRQARLLQHYTQIRVQMIAVPKLDAEARRIGF